MCRSKTQNEITCPFHISNAVKIIHIHHTVDYCRSDVWGVMMSTNGFFNDVLKRDPSWHVTCCFRSFNYSYHIRCNMRILVYCIRCNLNPACGSGNWPTPKAKVSPSTKYKNLNETCCLQQFQHICKPVGLLVLCCYDLKSRWHFRNYAQCHCVGRNVSGKNVFMQPN